MKEYDEYIYENEEELIALYLEEDENRAQFEKWAVSNKVEEFGNDKELYMKLLDDKQTVWFRDYLKVNKEVENKFDDLTFKQYESEEDYDRSMEYDRKRDQELSDEEIDNT
jgi:hypothetical protein